MNNLGIVIQREYFTRVKKKSFIILTLIMPFLMALMVFVPVLFENVKDDSKKQVFIVDKTQKYERLFVEAQLNDSTASGEYMFVPSAGKEDISSLLKEADAVLSITGDLLECPDSCSIYSNSEVQQSLLRYVNDVIGDELYREKIAAYNVPQLEKIIDDVQATQFSAKTIKCSDDGKASESNSFAAIAIGIITAFLIYMFVLAYGSMVMQGVMEEKTNRIVEVIVGSVKPFELMMGKILGIMLVGFTQILIWIIMLVVILGVVGVVFGASVDAASMNQAAIVAAADPAVSGGSSFVNNVYSAIMNLPLVEILVLFVLYFIGGYVLYSSYYAAVGASVNSPEDSSQFTMPMIIMMVIALYGAMGSMNNTDGPLAFWCSMFPLTSPIVMMVRIPLGVPLWQEVLSVVLLYATAITFVWIGARIYRVGILMYGKKPTFKELGKWIRFK